MKKVNMRLWLRRSLLALAILSPLVLLIVLLKRYSVNVPFWDQWELVTIFEKCFNGTLGFADFFAQHNEHRIVFPRLIMFVMAVFTHWNTLYEVGANVVLASGVFGFLWLMLRNTLTDKKLLYIGAFIVSLILFSPSQFENWMWGWQIQWFSNVLGLVVAVWALSVWRARPAWRLLVAILAGVVATYSLGSGFFVWAVCAPLVWFARDLRSYLHIWIGAGLIAVGVHYMGYVDPAYHPSKLLFLQQPIGFVAYFLVYIGRPVVVDFLVSIPVTLVYLASFAASLIFTVKKYASHLTTTLLPWLAIGLYAIFAGLSTDLSRLGFGVEQAYSSRYITLSNLLLIAACVVSFKLIELIRNKKEAAQKTAKKLSGMFIVVAVLLVGVNYVKGVQQMRERHAYLLEVQACARIAGEGDDCLLKLYPDQKTVWPRLQFLRSIHWGGL